MAQQKAREIDKTKAEMKKAKDGFGGGMSGMGGGGMGSSGGGGGPPVATRDASSFEESYSSRPVQAPAPSRPPMKGKGAPCMRLAQALPGWCSSLGRHMTMCTWSVFLNEA